MKCCDVEPLLDQLARSSVHDRDTDRSAVQDHLATCPSCRSAVRSLARWDRQLTHAMSDIPVPKGLSQRLLTVLDQPRAIEVNPAPIADSADTSPKNMRSRSRAARVFRGFAGFAICCLLAVAAWGTWRFTQPPMVSSSDIATLLQQPVEQLEAGEDSRHLLPQQWASLRGKVRILGWKQAELGTHRLAVAMVPLEIRFKRVPSVAGSLMVIPKSRWKPLPTLPVSQAPVQYSPPHVWIFWAEGDLVYILTVNGSPPILEQLQRQLDGRNSVL